MTTLLRRILPALGVWGGRERGRRRRLPAAQHPGNVAGDGAGCEHHAPCRTEKLSQTLPLADKEVVLTFDDGPNPPTTKRVLTALANPVRARDLLRHRPERSGPPGPGPGAGGGGPHHRPSQLWSHPNLGRMSRVAADANIARGIAADQAALGGAADERSRPGFFRFPLSLRRRPCSTHHGRQPRGVRRRSVGQRLEPDATAPGAQSDHPKAAKSPQRHHSVSRQQSPDRGDASGFPPIPCATMATVSSMLSPGRSSTRD